jgi:DNA-binding PadR family transcriptional regulator
MNVIVCSYWETNDSGPARRVYKITKQGEKHLEEWSAVLENLSKSMAHFVRGARKALQEPKAKRTQPSQ